jgi:light-regulated signal transduction histidine kinase (bacteriophytochrome)
MTDIHDQKNQAETLERMVEQRTSELTALNANLKEEILERTRAEERERSTAVELKRSNEELEKFAYVASHDLQEPLRKIQAFGDRLKSKCYQELNDHGRDYLQRMMDSASRMHRLINDLLSYSRVASKPQEFELVDLAQIARDAVSDLEARILQSGAEVHIGNLPMIQADPLQMRQLLQNLIGNALKFQKKEISPSIIIAGEVIGTKSEPYQTISTPKAICRLTISDNGIGFDEKYLDRIFEVFQRLHGREEYEGTGIGLAMCRKIVERHGGKITARSQPGGGAVFLVDLPLNPSSTG